LLRDRRLIMMPAKKVITDLVSRNGFPDDDSVSPYKGQAKEFSRQFALGEIPVSALALIDSQADYNADKQQPGFGVYMPEVIRSGVHARRFEEIDESYVVQYLKNVITGIKINRNNSIREENRRVRELNVMEDSDGDFVEVSATLEERYEISATDMQKYMEKLPYLLKRLHDKSKESGISLLSLLIAYEKAKKSVVLKNHDVKPGEILAEGVYFMSSSGNITTRVTENKHKVHEVWMKWIRGYEEFRDSYFYDAMELLNICDALKLSIAEEDPLEYQEDFISSLAITYIAKNREVVLRGCRPVNRSMLAELKTVTLGDYKRTQAEPVKVFDIKKLARRKMQRFLGTSDENINSEQLRDRDVLSFTLALESKTEQQIKISHAHTSDGFYMSDRTNPIIVDVSCIYGDTDRNKAECIIHTSGYLVLLSDTVEMYYMDIKLALEYIGDIMFGDPSVKNKRYSNGKSFGKWEATLL
jgi:hypothetical protein